MSTRYLHDKRWRRKSVRLTSTSICWMNSNFPQPTYEVLCKCTVLTITSQCLCDLIAAYVSTVGSGVFCVMRSEVISCDLPNSFQFHPCGRGMEYLHRDPASRRRRRKGTRTQERLRGRVPAYIKYRPVLSSERASNKNRTAIVKD
jgi:hypothetical protein